MFKSLARLKPSEVLFTDRFRQVELAIAFKKILCYNCQFSGIYKFRVQQIRRRPEIQLETGEEIRPDHVEIWETIPRFAEIPETVKCKRCREVLTPEVTCIY